MFMNGTYIDCDWVQVGKGKPDSRICVVYGNIILKCHSLSDNK